MRVDYLDARAYRGGPQGRKFDPRTLEFANGEVLLVNPSEPEQLAEGIEAILFDPAVRKAYIEGAERRRLHWGGLTSAAEQHAKILEGTIRVPPS